MPLWAAILWAGLTVLSTSAEARIRPVVDVWYLCAEATARAERTRRIPEQLLTAISLVEAGRHHATTGRTLAWPWTVMAEGRGRYLPTKAAAIREVERLRARGVANIDVGCMQINLHWHREAFDDLAEAFDPAQNVAVAATFLTSLRDELGVWDKAIAYYHSRTPQHHVPYRRKVRAAWRLAKRDATPPYLPLRGTAAPPAADNDPANGMPVVAALPRKHALTPRLTPPRQVRILRNDPRSIAWRRARPGLPGGTQVILRKGAKQVILKPGRSWAGLRTPAVRPIASTAPES
jgi:hypothetical protein